MLTRRRVRQLLAEHGYELVRLTVGRHYKVVAKRDGRIFHFVFPRTPTGRWLANLSADLRRGYHRGDHHQKEDD